LTARASRIKFDVNKIFPLNDPLSVPLLRLMIATDDARHLQKLMMMAPDVINQENKTERAIFEGEMGHLFRLLCGHLYEARAAFRSIDSNQSSIRLDKAVADSEQAKKALKHIREAYDPNEEGAFGQSFLEPIRHYVGFHYKDEKVRETLAKYKDSELLDGTLALVEFSGLGRYTVTDSLVKLVIADALGEDVVTSVQKFEKLMGEAIKLAGDLAEVVDHLLIHLFDLHPEMNVEKDKDVVIVPASLQQAREENAAERREDRRP